MTSLIKKKKILKVTKRQAIEAIRFGVIFKQTIHEIHFLERSFEEAKNIKTSKPNSFTWRPLGIIGAEYMETMKAIVKRMDLGEIEEYILRFVQSETETDLN